MPPRIVAHRALLLAAAALALELLMTTPWVDHVTEKNPTVHYTQHGLIFLGGVIIGFAIRDLGRR
jgi:hypothetical protein